MSKKPVKGQEEVKAVAESKNIMNHEFGEGWVIVVSRLSHPMSISYMGEQVMVPPRGRTQPLKKQGLGALPAGAMIVPCSQK